MKAGLEPTLRNRRRGEQARLRRGLADQYPYHRVRDVHGHSIKRTVPAGNRLGFGLVAGPAHHQRLWDALSGERAKDEAGRWLFALLCALSAP